jgi:hypothetical protein
VITDRDCHSHSLAALLVRAADSRKSESWGNAPIESAAQSEKMADAYGHCTVLGESEFRTWHID